MKIGVDRNKRMIVALTPKEFVAMGRPTHAYFEFYPKRDKNFGRIVKCAAEDGGYKVGTYGAAETPHAISIPAPAGTKHFGMENVPTISRGTGTSLIIGKPKMARPLKKAPDPARAKQVPKADIVITKDDVSAIKATVDALNMHRRRFGKRLRYTVMNDGRLSAALSLNFEF